MMVPTTPVSADSNNRRSRAYWSTRGFCAGFKLAASGIPVMAVFGVAFGAAAAQKGLSLFEATLMSALVFGGAAQFVAIELWTKPMTYTAIVAIAVITASVNMRFLLMSASLRPWLGTLPASQTYPALAILNDPGWLLAMRYRSEGGANAATFLASNAALWLIWIGATAPGHAVGALVDDPKRLGLDVVMPCFFVVMLVPLWRGLRWAIPWTVSGGIALLTFAAVPGWWFMIAGAVAGSLTAGFLDDEG